MHWSLLGTDILWSPRNFRASEAYMTQFAYQPVSIPSYVRLKPSNGFRFSFYLETAILNPE